MAEIPWTEPAVPSGTMGLLLKLENAAFALVAIALYSWIGASWWLFAILILAPDLGFLGYLFGPKAGAATYNALHVTALPLGLGLAGLFFASNLSVAVALIWLAHIGIDRAFGYGLKYPAGFAFTHLGRIGQS
jgi:hypothetical protein